MTAAVVVFLCIVSSVSDAVVVFLCIVGGLFFGSALIATVRGWWRK